MVHFYLKKIANQIKYWYRKYVPEIIRKIIRESVPFWVQLRYFNIQTKNFDFDIQGHGEAKKLLEICSELNISNGYYVDIGASDGWSSSSTFSFAKSKNFSGLSVELDDKKFKKMQYIYKNFHNAHLSKTKVTPVNIIDLLNEFDVPQNFDILNLDIDSYDLYVIKNLLKSFQPKIVSMEINEKIPPPIYFTVKYDENHYWKGDHFFGCSLQAAHEDWSPFYDEILNNLIISSSYREIGREQYLSPRGSLYESISDKCESSLSENYAFSKKCELYLKPIRFFIKTNIN